MKNFILASIVAAAPLPLVVQPAAAQDVLRKASLGYMQIDGDGAAVGSVAVRYNAGFGEFLGVEGEISHGVLSDEVSGVDVDAGFGYGLFGTVRYPLTDAGTDVFVRLGYAAIDLEAELSGFTASEEVNGVAYGVGGNWMVNHRHGLRLDYTRLDGDDGDADAYGVSYVFQY